MKTNKISQFCMIFNFCLLSLSAFNLHSKAFSEDELIEECKKEIATYSRYGQSFNAKSSKNNDKESEIEELFAKLGMKLDDIDHGLYANLHQTNKDLLLINKKLSKCNKKNPDVIAIQKDIKFYSLNINHILSSCHKHKNFITGYQILNFYSDINSEQNKFVEWVSYKINSSKTKTSFGEWFVGMTSNFTVYPLISYKSKVESDIKWIKKMQTSEYGDMSRKLKKIEDKMQESIGTLQKTNEYRIELQEQRKDQRQANFNSSLLHYLR